MPPVIVAVVALAFEYITVETFVVIVATYALNAVINALQPKPKGPTPLGQTVTQNDPVSNVIIAYGHVRSGGVNLIPALAYDPTNKGRYFHQVLGLSYAPYGVGGLLNFWVDQVSIAAGNVAAVTGSSGDGLVNATQFANVIWMRFYNGLQSATDWILNNQVSSVAFGPNFVGHDWCYAAIQYDWADGTPWQGVGRQASVEFNGCKIYDPRLDTSPGANPTNATYYAFSSNPALVLADFLKSPVGGTFTASDIDWSMVVTAANVCDATVVDSTSANVPRYTCNGVITAGPEYFTQNLKLLCDSMLGFLSWRNGQWRMRAGGWATPSYTINQADWISVESVTLCAGRATRPNKVEGFFIDTTQNWSRKECFPRQNAAFQAQDGETLTNGMEQPLCINESECQRKCEFVLRQSRNGVKIAGRLGPKWQRLSIFDTVNLNFAMFGWTNKTFRVIHYALNSDSSINVVLGEEQSTDWTDLIQSDYNTPSVAGIPSNQFPTPSMPLGFGLTVINDTISFVWSRPAHYPPGTRYKIWYYPGSLSAVSSKQLLWDGADLGKLVKISVISMQWYQAQAYVGSYYSDFAPNTYGIGGQISEIGGVGASWGIAVVPTALATASTPTAFGSGYVRVDVTNSAAPVYSWWLASSCNMSITWPSSRQTTFGVTSMAMDEIRNMTANCTVTDSGGQHATAGVALSFDRYNPN